MVLQDSLVTVTRVPKRIASHNPPSLRKRQVSWSIATLAVSYVGFSVLLHCQSIRNSTISHETNKPSTRSLLVSNEPIASRLPVTTWTQNTTRLARTSEHVDYNKFIFFDNDLTGQGMGNIVSGLLSAHLLGLEFGRIVCILPSYREFLEVFEAIGTDAVTQCPLMLQNGLPPMNRQNLMYLVNYKNAPDECMLQDQLNSNETVLFLLGNTYPRWPAVPPGFFWKHYRAKAVLLNALPYDKNNPPTTVVHLRAPDGKGQRDRRAGLDPETLSALGRTVGSGPNTYLVTNQVSFYQQFSDCCQWSHPHWTTVIHSANPKQQWGDTGNHTNSREMHSTSQNIQMWADWYTVLTARDIYHTHSDFSISAIHWVNNFHSHNIVGRKFLTGELETKQESWRIDGETVPLSQRTRHAEGRAKLAMCQTNFHPSES